MEKYLYVLNQLETSVEKGRFLPFLGSGVAGLRTYNDRDWLKVAQRLYEIRERLKINKEEPGPVMYLDSFAKSHQIDLEDDRLSFQESDLSINDQGSEGLLTDIQKNIVILGAKLVEFFGKQMETSFTSVKEISEYEIPINIKLSKNTGTTNTDESTIKRKKILIQLFDTMKSLIKYLENKGSNQDLLKGEVILEKLLIFCIRFGDPIIYEKDFSNELNDKYYDFKNRIKTIKSFLKEALNPMETLLLDELGWMEDLLWYTLRFDIPVYLTQNEMTFLLSLELSFYELRRLEMPQAAEMRKIAEDYSGSVKPLELIRDHLLFCKRAKPKFDKNQFPEPTDFHLVLAAALCDQFDQRKNDDWSEGPLPITISTNFDQELEWAFMKLKKPYIVVFPLEVNTDVTVGKEENGKNYPEIKSEKRIKWLWRQYCPPDYGEDAACTDYDCSAWEESVLFESKYLTGPIIIKLHGSPLERKPSDDIFKGAQHFIMLSEHDFLKATVFTQKNKFYPGWLESQQEAKKGDWWFLGYNINNWYERMRIYQHVSYTLKDHNSRDIRKWLINLTRDLDKGQLLDNLEFTRTVTDLDAVTVTLSGVASVKKILNEANVQLSRF